MKKFGILKMKMLKTLTDSYTKNDKKEMKKIINTIKEDKDFKELYLLYEDIENKYFEDDSIAKLYVEELSLSIKGKIDKITPTYKKLNKLFENTQIDGENDLYQYLDQLIESDNLFNIDKKVMAKKNLIDFLLKKKENIIENKIYTNNENLLHTVLTNNFNNLYNWTLNEEQKDELKKLLTLTNEELEKKMKELKESVNEKITSILTNHISIESENLNKLKDVKKEVDEMSTSKYNLYRLKELKNGLN